MALFEPIFRALDAASVRYVTVGGVAVVLHGYARMTADLDLAVDLAAEPAAAAIEALTTIGFQPRAHANDPLRSVALFVANPIDFEDLWEHSEVVDLAGTPARIASIPDLIRLKKIAARPLDLDDIQALEGILAERQEGR